MAASIFSFSFFNFILSTSLITLLIFLSFDKGLALEGTQAVESNFHTIHISSLIASPSSCKTSAQGASRKSSLKVIHRHGPCSQLSQGETNTPTLAEVLTRDQARVASIQGRQAFRAGTNVRDSKVDIPAKSGLSLGTLNYIVTVGLGTPMQSVSLIFDTGSDLTWTQCLPCACEGCCQSQQGPIFDPSKSTSYSNITCTSTQCSELTSGTGDRPRCSTGTCVYDIQYLDSTFSEGFFGKEKLTIAPTDVFDNFLFGCGQNNSGLFARTAGFLGLGLSTLSVVSQTAQKYGKYFSYCLPTMSGSDGHLTFGNSEVPNGVQFTPFSNSQGGPFYFIDISALFVGGQKLSISPSVFENSGTIIDSGTVITRLPPAAYTALSNAFKQQMKQYPSAPALSIFDTCYDFSNYSTVTFPKIGILFNGDLKVDLPTGGILFFASPSQVCLAFAGNSADTDLGIFGNAQQQTLEVVYDVAGGKLGIGPGGCS